MGKVFVKLSIVGFCVSRGSHSSESDHIIPKCRECEEGHAVAFCNEVVHDRLKEMCVQGKA